MKKLLVLGLSACLLFSFGGSAFAATPTNTQAKKKVVHTAVSKKHTVYTVSHAKKELVHADVSKKNTVHSLTAHAKKKVVHSAVSSKKPITYAKKNAVSTSNSKVKKAIHTKTSAGQPQQA